jgi:hypothetical protein
VLIFLVIGIGLLGGAIYLAHDTRQFVATASIANGEVIDLIESRDSDDDPVYRPRVRFQTPDGVVREFTSTVGSNPAGFYVGEGVDVMYDPRQPSDARIDTLFQLWFAPMLLAVMGTVFTAFGVFALRAGKNLALEMPAQPPMETPSAEPPHKGQESAPASQPDSAARAPVVDRTERD